MLKNIISFNQSYKLMIIKVKYYYTFISLSYKSVIILGSFNYIN